MEQIYTNATLTPALQSLDLHFEDPSRITYRDLKEAFVTGHTGVDSYTELSVQLLSVGLWMTIRRVAGLLYQSSTSRTPFTLYSTAAQGRSRTRSFLELLPSFFFDFLIVVFPFVFSVTTLADQYFAVFSAQLFTLLLLILLHRSFSGHWCLHNPFQNSQKSSSSTSAWLLQRLNQSPKPFISAYRTSLMLGTSIAILAVDFTFFPRRYCKTETYGLGLMDGGVGSFILSHALTSIHARGKQLQAGGRSNGVSGLLSQVSHILRSIMPLLFLGIARLFTIKASNYQEHVSEYGVHWNFFFTLAAVAVLSGMLSRAIHPRSAVLFGAVLIGLYQLALSFTSLTDYIFHAPRVNFFSANKEGLWSSLGYFAMYLMAVRGGFECLKSESSLPEWVNKLKQLAVVDVGLWILTMLSSEYITPSSRRLINLTYVLWMISINLMLLLFFLAMDIIIVDKPSSVSVHHGHKGEDVPAAVSTSSMIVEAINKNSLPFFLLCNLCTGAINLSMQTLFASDALSMLVVQLYAFVTCLAIVYIDYRGWIIKM